jgi:hypothetical protein
MLGPQLLSSAARLPCYAVLCRVAACRLLRRTRWVCALNRTHATQRACCVCLARARCHAPRAASDWWWGFVDAHGRSSSRRSCLSTRLRSRRSWCPSGTRIAARASERLVSAPVRRGLRDVCGATRLLVGAGPPACRRGAAIWRRNTSIGGRRDCAAVDRCASRRPRRHVRGAAVLSAGESPLLYRRLGECTYGAMPAPACCRLARAMRARGGGRMRTATPRDGWRAVRAACTRCRRMCPCVVGLIVGQFGVVRVLRRTRRRVSCGTSACPCELRVRCRCRLRPGSSRRVYSAGGFRVDAGSHSSESESRTACKTRVAFDSLVFT